MTSVLNRNDLIFVTARIPTDVRELMHEFGLSLGGGFIREVIAGGEPKDIDLFGPNKERLVYALQELERRRSAQGQRCRIHKTDNADTLITDGRLPVQVIHRWTYEIPAMVVQDFDFTVCAAVVWRSNETGLWTSRCHDNFYADLAARRLVYTSPQRAEDAGGSLLRVIKFVKRGYNIQTVSLGAVVSRLMSAYHWKEGDGEQHMARVVTGLLKEVDPGFIVDGIDATEPVPEQEID